MIKVTFDNYDHSDESYEKEIEGNLPKGVKSVEASYDGGRGSVWVGSNHVLDDLGAGDYDVSHNAISVSVDRGRFYCSGEDFDFKDLGAGNDFHFIFKQI